MRAALAIACSSIPALAARSPRQSGSSAGPKAPVNGFSTITCLPAAAAAMTQGSWEYGGAQTSITSETSSNRSSEEQAATPWRSAKASRRSGVGE